MNIDPSEQLKEQLDSAKRREAVLREALQSVVDSAVHPDVAVRSVMVPLQPIRDALSQSTPPTLFTAEQLQPLVDALQHVWDWSCQEDGDELDADFVFRGLHQARAIGLVKEDKP